MEQSIRYGTGARQQRVFEYGGMAWMWRVLAVPFVVGGLALTAWAVRWGEYWGIASGLALVGPVVYYFSRVATGLTLTSEGGQEYLIVQTLAGITRRVATDRLAGSRYSRTATSRSGGVIYAPSVWLRAQGAPSIYIDLFAHIHDRETLARLIDQPLERIPAPRA